MNVTTKFLFKKSNENYIFLIDFKDKMYFYISEIDYFSDRQESKLSTLYLYNCVTNLPNQVLVSYVKKVA